MRNDTMIKHDGFRAISEKLDLVEVARFIALVKRDNFDYTEWRKNLWEDQATEEFSRNAMQHFRKDLNS